MEFAACTCKVKKIKNWADFFLKSQPFLVILQLLNNNSSLKIL